MEVQELKEVRRWGNSAGILVPREWLGKQVKVILIDRSENIKKEVLEILSPYLRDIRGLYLTGSYARGEQEKDSDIDIIAISNSTRKNISSGKYNIEIYTIKGVIDALRHTPLLLYPRFREAKPIINESLLEDIKAIKINYSSWKHYVGDCDDAIKSNRELIELDKKEGNLLKSNSVVYSLILRLRGTFILHSILNNSVYKKIEFEKWLRKETVLTETELKKTISIYKNIRDGKKIKEYISIEASEKLMALLKNEVKKLGKKKKAS